MRCDLAATGCFAHHACTGGHDRVHCIATCHGCHLHIVTTVACHCCHVLVMCFRHCDTCQACMDSSCTSDITMHANTQYLICSLRDQPGPLAHRRARTEETTQGKGGGGACCKTTCLHMWRMCADTWCYVMLHMGTSHARFVMHGALACGAR